MIDRCIHLGYTDPAAGAVPNPGMGVNAYVFSDHMHTGYSEREFQESEITNPNRKLDKATFLRMLELPYVDNLYFRIDWNRIQQEPGRLCFPEEWEWMLEAVESRGKRWSFRVMNASRHSAEPSSVPAFLLDRLPMEAYKNDYRFGPPLKYYPAYTEEYLKWWRELLYMLAQRYDRHPLLEYVDISGYGLWGEGHHYAVGPGENRPANHHAPAAERVISSLIGDHLAAFPNTPAAMTLHYLDYEAGVRAVEETDVWLRRDSFQIFSSPYEYDAVTRRKPGRAILWETLLPFHTHPAPLFHEESLIQRYFDWGAHYAAVGFNPWDVLAVHRYRPDIYETLTSRLGYRIRPSVVWRRYSEENGQELVVALCNDGCADVPGVLTLSAHFPDGRCVVRSLPAGAPFPGSRERYVLPMPAETWGCDSEQDVILRLQLRMKGKTFPVRWAVKHPLANPFDLPFPLRRPPEGDPFLTPAGDFHPTL